MDFITGVGLGNAAIAATAAYGAKDKTFEEKFNERIKVYEDEKKSLEKMIEILKKEKAACESTKAVETRPAESVEVPDPEPVVPVEVPQSEPALVVETAPTETNTLVPEVPVPGPEIPQPQPTVEPLNEPLLPEVPLEPEPALFPTDALPAGPPAAPPETPPEPDVAAAATRRSLYQRSLQGAREAAEADTVQFANLPTMDATVSRPLPALPPRPPRSFSRPDFNPSEERTAFPPPTRGRTRGGRITRKKKLRTRRATKQKNV